MLFRSGYTGEDGFEIYIANGEAPRLWKELLEAGAEFGIKPAGLGARNTLRLEAAMALYGHEITEEIDPLSAGLAFAVKLDKGAGDEREGRFIGQDALEAIAKAGTKHALVGFEVDGRRAARQGMGIHRGGEHVGHVTSGCLSPTLDKVIAMGYVPAELSAEGTEFEIDLGKARTAAKVVKMPFYNPVRAK